MTSCSLADLQKTLTPHVCLGKTRLETLCLLVLGMISTRTVNLSHIASERPARVKVASTYLGNCGGQPVDFQGAVLDRATGDCPGLCRTRQAMHGVSHSGFAVGQPGFRLERHAQPRVRCGQSLPGPALPSGGTREAEQLEWITTNLKPWDSHPV